ncbi:MAG: DUF1761 domain-containing protein [Nanoarchaeota archaeon]|nr:DUF1761 domain-containing protein [Nanoarchaeota archaeon]
MNYLAILVASIASIILGSIWYSPSVFGNIWMKLSGITSKQLSEAKKKSMAGTYLMAIIGSLVMAYVLARLAGLLKTSTLGGAVELAFWAWLGFIATTTLSSVLWEGKPAKLWWLHNAYNLLNMIIMSTIVVLWV